MKGIFLGDILGSSYEFYPKRIDKTKLDLFEPDRSFRGSRFTDDTLSTLIVMEHLILKTDFIKRIKYAFMYDMKAGWGDRFAGQMLFDEPNDSFGNGAVMRILPVAVYYDNLETILSQGKRITRTTHNTYEAVQAVDILLEIAYHLKKGKKLIEVVKRISDENQIDLEGSLTCIQGTHVDCRAKSMVQSVIPCLINSESIEDALKNAISIGGDTDTRAAIVGGLAEIYYKDSYNQRWLEQSFEKVNKWDNLFLYDSNWSSIVEAFYDEIYVR